MTTKASAACIASVRKPKLAPCWSSLRFGSRHAQTSHVPIPGTDVTSATRCGPCRRRHIRSSAMRQREFSTACPAEFAVEQYLCRNRSLLIILGGESGPPPTVKAIILLANPTDEPTKGVFCSELTRLRSFGQNVRVSDASATHDRRLLQRTECPRCFRCAAIETLLRFGRIFYFCPLCGHNWNLLRLSPKIADLSATAGAFPSHGGGLSWWP